jgi:hypothetical protein
MLTDRRSSAGRWPAGTTCLRLSKSIPILMRTAGRGQPQSLERILRPRPSSMAFQAPYFRPRAPRGPDPGGAAGISSAWIFFEPTMVLGRGPPLAPSTPGTCAGPRPGSPRCGTGPRRRSPASSASALSRSRSGVGRPSPGPNPQLIAAPGVGPWINRSASARPIHGQC